MILYNEDLSKLLQDQFILYRDFRDIFKKFFFKKFILKKSRDDLSNFTKSKITEFNAYKEGTIVILPFSYVSKYDIVIWINLSPDQMLKFVYLKSFL